MRKLLSAHMRRLLINRTFWITVILMALTEGFCCVVSLRRDDIPMDVVLFLTLQCIGIFAAIFMSLFLGTEYSDGTIRNKIIAGHTRTSIYLASLVTGIIAVTVIFLAEVLTGSVMGLLLYAPPQHSINQIVLAFGIGWLACISFVAIFTLVGLLSSSKALTAIINMSITFGLMFSGMYIFQQLGKPSLWGVKKEIYQVLFEVSPFGQILEAMMVGINSPWRLVAYALLLFSALTGLGLYCFHKKDLK